MLDLGSKHRRYGVKPDMFPIMGESLIKMLEKVLGDSFSQNKRDAWLETYGELSADMIEGQK